MLHGFGVLGHGLRGGHFWLGPVVGGIFWLLVIAALVMFVLWVVRERRYWHHQAYAHGMHHYAGAPTTPDSTAEAVAIAKRRLASGEITPEQYQEIVKTLGT
jgi:uncharacterized membrane protein